VCHGAWQKEDKAIVCKYTNMYKTAVQKHIIYIKHILCFADFATMSKRLGELWATVPTNEKYVSTCACVHRDKHTHIEDCIQYT
jgi:hypothetical protein